MAVVQPISGKLPFAVEQVERELVFQLSFPEATGVVKTRDEIGGKILKQSLRLFVVAVERENELLQLHDGVMQLWKFKRVLSGQPRSLTDVVQECDGRLFAACRGDRSRAHKLSSEWRSGLRDEFRRLAQAIPISLVSLLYAVEKAPETVAGSVDRL